MSLLSKSVETSLRINTIVVEDCVGDRNLNSHEVNLHDLNAKYADIVSSRELILEIEKSN